jgi:hypothetical protein
MKSLRFVIAGLLTFTAACGVAEATLGGETAELTAEGEDSLSATSQSFVTLRHDARKCLSPVCGGYFVADVNRATLNEVYVSGLDFSLSGLAQADVDDVLAAEPGELLLRGKLGPVESVHRTRAFRVTEAYRGMPGVARGAGELFYRAADRVPAINCFAAPCNNELATKLNFTATTAFTSLSVDSAALAYVDTAWLSDRVLKHGALVSAKFVNGKAYPAGPEKVLDSSQVYLRMPDVKASCPTFGMMRCPEGSTVAFTRSADRCMKPAGCVPVGKCTQVPPSCAAGYQLASWAVAPRACAQFACDVSFAGN